MATLPRRRQTSTSTPYAARELVVLPSIRELFPEHIPRSHATAPRSASPPVQQHPYSVDLHRPYPALQHLAFPRSAPAYFLSTFALKPVGSESAEHSSSWSSESSGDVDDAGDGLSSQGKKNICPTCRKSFIRPSSLRIHANTHTGATRELHSCIQFNRY